MVMGDYAPGYKVSGCSRGCVLARCIHAAASYARITLGLPLRDLRGHCYVRAGPAESVKAGCPFIPTSVHAGYTSIIHPTNMCVHVVCVQRARVDPDMEYAYGGGYGSGGGMMMGPMFPCVKLRGLPFDVTEEDVRMFLVRVDWVLPLVLVHLRQQQEHPLFPLFHDWKRCGFG
jgi:hypothetical protein